MTDEKQEPLSEEEIAEIRNRGLGARQVWVGCSCGAVPHRDGCPRNALLDLAEDQDRLLAEIKRLREENRGLRASCNSLHRATQEGFELLRSMPGDDIPKAARRALRDVRAEEREACARIALDHGEEDHPIGAVAARSIAAKIRSRGET